MGHACVIHSKCDISNCIADTIIAEIPKNGTAKFKNVAQLDPLFCADSTISRE